MNVKHMVPYFFNLFEMWLIYNITRVVFMREIADCYLDFANLTVEMYILCNMRLNKLFKSCRVRDEWFEGLFSFLEFIVR